MTMPSAIHRPPAVTGRPLERIEAELVTLASQLTAATARFIGLVGDFDRAEGWRDWGMQSTAQWLSWKCGVGLVAAREQVRVARALRSLPRIAAEFAAGRLSYSKVRAVTRLADADNETELTMLARSATAAQLDRLLANHRRVVRAEAARARRAREHFTVRIDDDGCLVGSFRIAPERAAIVLQALDVQAEDARSRAAALVDMCERSVRDASAEASGAGIDICQVVLHTSAAELAKSDDADDDGDGSQMVTTRGTAVRVHPSTARRVSCDCPASVMVDGVDGAALHLGRKTRRITGRLRRAVRARDAGRCRAPGCTSGAAQIHHVRHWANGGSTCLPNLISLCDRHHWLVHEGGFALVPRGSNEWALLGPTGVVADDRPVPVEDVEPLPVDESIDPDAVTGTWSGDRLDHVAALSSLATRPHASAEASPVAPAGARASAEAPEDRITLTQAQLDRWCAFVDGLETSASTKDAIWIDD